VGRWHGGRIFTDLETKKLKCKTQNQNSKLKTKDKKVAIYNGANLRVWSKNCGFWVCCFSANSLPDMDLKKS